MERCSPLEMRKNLNLVDTMKQLGMDFVPVPVANSHHKQKLLVDVFEILGRLEDDSENC